TSTSHSRLRLPDGCGSAPWRDCKRGFAAEEMISCGEDCPGRGDLRSGAVGRAETRPQRGQRIWAAARAAAAIVIRSVPRLFIAQFLETGTAPLVETRPTSRCNAGGDQRGSWISQLASTRFQRLWRLTLRFGRAF